MIDLVVNHTSDQHPWFQEARRDPRSKYRDYYVWSDTRPENHDEGMVFPGVQKTTWTRDPVANQYYFHRLYEFQPDLHTENPLVLAEIRKIMGFYLELGVCGFRLGPEKSMQLYGRGIRRRLAPMLHGDRRRLELAYSLLFTLPGTPVIRYGDELGMGDDLALPERNCARTPMQWSTEEHAGFTRGKPILPVIAQGPYGCSKVNAADQRRDPGSLLN